MSFEDKGRTVIFCGDRYVPHAEMTYKCRCTILLMLLYRKVEISVQQSKTQSARNNHAKSQQDTRNKAQLRCGYGCKFSTVHLPLNSRGWGEDSVFRRTAEVSYSSNWSVILSARLVQLNPQPKSCQGHKHTHTVYKHTRFEKCSHSLADLSFGKQSPICHLSVQLESKQTNTKSCDLSKSSYSFQKLCNARTNSCFLVNKAQSTGWVVFYKCVNSRWKGHIERKMDFTLR